MLANRGSKIGGASGDKRAVLDHPSAIGRYAAQCGKLPHAFKRGNSLSRLPTGNLGGVDLERLRDLIT